MTTEDRTTVSVGAKEPTTPEDGARTAIAAERSAE